MRIFEAEYMFLAILFNTLFDDDDIIVSNLFIVCQ